MKFELDFLKNNLPSVEKQANDLVEYFEDDDYNLIPISKESALFIVESAKSSSANFGRVVLSTSLPILTTGKFRRSLFLNEYNIHKAISAVMEEVFRVQSETDDAFSDEELISAFFKFFESKNCCGSLELLTDFATQIIEYYNKYEPNPLSDEDLSFTTLDFEEPSDEEDAQ